MGPQFLPLIGELTEGLHPAGDGITGRLVARLYEQFAVRNQLLAGQGRAVHLALDQLGDQIVLGMLPAGRHHRREVAVQLAAGPHGGLLGALSGEPVLGIVLADDLIGPSEVVLPIVVGHTQDPRDHRHRKRCGEGVDKVAFLDLAPGRSPVDDLGSDPVDLLTTGPDRTA